VQRTLRVGSGPSRSSAGPPGAGRTHNGSAGRRAVAVAYCHSTVTDCSNAAPALASPGRRGFAHRGGLGDRVVMLLVLLSVRFGGIWRRQRGKILRVVACPFGPAAAETSLKAPVALRVACLARVAESVDAADLRSVALKGVWVRVPRRASNPQWRISPVVGQSAPWASACPDPEGPPRICPRVRRRDPAGARPFSLCPRVLRAYRRALVPVLLRGWACCR
jgi:hypothetical protein